MPLTDAEMLVLDNKVSASMDAVDVARNNFRKARIAVYQAQQDVRTAKQALETAERQLAVDQRDLLVALKAR